jgi:hypothetical protein
MQPIPPNPDPLGGQLPSLPVMLFSPPGFALPQLSAPIQMQPQKIDPSFSPPPPPPPKPKAVPAAPAQIQYVNDFDELDVDKETPLPGETDTSGRPRRAKTAYFLFLDARRPEIAAKLAAQGQQGDVSRVAKAAGEEWRELSAAAKAEWAAKAGLDRKRFDKEKAEWKQKGGQDVTEEALPVPVITPVKFVRDLMHMDKDTNKVSPLTIRLIAKGTDLFMGALAEESIKRGDKKRIRLVDVHHAVYADDTHFGFLSQDFEPAAQVAFKQDRERSSKPRKASTAATTAKQGQISSFFLKV